MCSALTWKSLELALLLTNQGSTNLGSSLVQVWSERVFASVQSVVLAEADFRFTLMFYPIAAGMESLRFLFAQVIDMNVLSRKWTGAWCLGKGRIGSTAPSS